MIDISADVSGALQQNKRGDRLLFLRLPSGTSLPAVSWV